MLKRKDPERDLTGGQRWGAECVCVGGVSKTEEPGG